MIRCGESIRFTSHELKDFRRIGLDFSDVKSQARVERALRTWAEVIAHERPELLDKIVRAMAEAKGLRPDEGPAGAAFDRV
jgi:hypothetical protein